MEFLTQALDILLHLDIHLNTWISALGPSIYIVLFLIIFCETGLVVTPFLPGDSLLFALGALCASANSSLNLLLLNIILTVAAILGDALNYKIGKNVGLKLFDLFNDRWLKRKHLQKTEEFYEKHGGKTIILARFMPIIRTFAPFVAGMGKMLYSRFFTFNIVGGILWVNSFTLLGYFFGNMPTVKNNFHYVIFGIIILSFLPLFIEMGKGYFKK